jgi:hypothetical protein
VERTLIIFLYIFSFSIGYKIFGNFFIVSIIVLFSRNNVNFALKFGETSFVIDDQQLLLFHFFFSFFFKLRLHSYANHFGRCFGVIQKVVKVVNHLPEISEYVDPYISCLFLKNSTKITVKSNGELLITNVKYRFKFTMVIIHRLTKHICIWFCGRN